VSAIDKRMFYLMLSVAEGQHYAQEMGFPPPSEEVQEQEQMDVMYRWGIFVATDVYSQIVETAEWLTTFLEHFDKLGSEAEQLREVLTVYGVALTNKLIDSEKMTIILDGLFKEVIDE